MRRLVLAACAVLATSAAGQEDPAGVLAAGLTSDSAEERRIAVRALRELGRLEPIRARAGDLLADLDLEVRCEALVALGDAARAEAWLLERTRAPGSRADVLDARTVLAVLLAGVDPRAEPAARQLAREFPREPKMFDHWFTGDAAIHLVESLPPIVADLLRPVGLDWLRGVQGPGKQAIGRRLVELGDEAFLGAVRERALGEPGRARYDAAMLLLETGRARAEDRAKLLEVAWQEASSAGFWPSDNFVQKGWHAQRLAELGAPGALERLLRFAREEKDARSELGWIALAGPIDRVRSEWPRARTDRQGAGSFARALLRAGTAEDRALVLDALAERFDREVMAAIEAAGPTQAEAARLGRILKDHFDRGTLPDRSPMDRGSSFVLGHRHGVPGMAAKLAALHPWRDHVAALYDVGAKAEARKMAEAVLAACGASWEEDAVRERLGVAAQLAAHDPEAARALLGPLVDLDVSGPTLAGALSFQTDADEPTQLVRAAAAAVLARGGNPEARKLLEQLRSGTFGWRRNRSIVWSIDVFDRREVAAWLEGQFGKLEHLDKMRGASMRLAGYDPAPGTAEEEILIAAALVALDAANARAAEVLRERVPSADGRALAEGLAALASSSSPRRIDLDFFDPVLAAEVERGSARRGDAEARRALEERLASDGADRLVAARALLESER